MASDRQTWRIGVLSFTGTGHLNPLIALSQELQARGHTVIFFDKSKIADRVRQSGFAFTPLDCNKRQSQRIYPNRRGPAIWSDISTLHFNLRQLSGEIEMFLRNAPPLLTRYGVKALVVDEVAITGPTVAELLHLPYFIISTSVPHNFGWSPSPWLSRRDYSGSWLDQLQRALLELSVFRLRGPLRNVIDRYRQHIGLSSVSAAQSLYPCLAHITQMPNCLDLPRTTLPSNFHYTGPFTSKAARLPVEFPWNRLDGRPLVYASLGTTRKIQPSVFRMIAQACFGLNVQLVISLGGRFDPEDFSGLPGGPLIVRYAPQLDLLKIASAVITHAGLNTILETIMEGVPMIAIPFGYDQPAVAARLARLKLAAILPTRGLSAEKIRAAVVSILSGQHYRESVQRIGATVRTLHGTEHAADLIEAALAQRQVLSHPLEVVAPCSLT